MGEIINRVRSYSGRAPNACMNEVGRHRFRIDAPAHHGGAPEAITPADAFLAGVSACGVLLVQSRAKELGLPLHHAQATIEGIRSGDDPSWFTRVAITFDLTGVSDEVGHALVRYYEDG